MANLPYITNGSAGLDDRKILNIFIDFYNKFVISDGAFVLQNFETNYALEFKGLTDTKKKATIHLTDGGEGVVQVYDDNGNSTIEFRGRVGLKIYNAAYSAPLFEVDRATNKIYYNGVEIATLANLSLYELLSSKGAASGYVPLNSSTKIDSTYLPSYVDDILEYANLAAFPASGETGKIYIALDTNFEYRWSGSAYIQITSSSAVWGSISGTLSSQTDLINALNLKAPLDSPALINTPTAPTATVGTNTAQIATTAFVLANTATPFYDMASARYSNVKYNNIVVTLSLASFPLNYVTATPILVGEPHTILDIAIEVTTAQAGGKARIALYTEDSLGAPLNLVEQSTELDCSTTGVKTYTFSTPRAVLGKKYFLIFTCNNATVYFRTTNGIPLLQNIGANIGNSYWYTYTYGSLPSSAYSFTYLYINTNSPVFTITKQ